jgi:hypothetical protein
MSRTRLLWPLSLLGLSACHPGALRSGDAAWRLQCTHEAAAYFKDTHPLDVTRETVLDGSLYIEQSTYELHFGPNSKHCYVMVSEEASVSSAEKPATGSSRKLFYDLEEHRELGSLHDRWPQPAGSVDECVLNGRRCTSSEQFREWAIAVWNR